MSTLCLKTLIRQMSLRHVQLKKFGSVWHKKLTREGGRLKKDQLIRRIESEKFYRKCQGKSWIQIL